MDYTQAHKELKDGNLGGAVFLYGSEQYLIENFAELVVSHYLNSSNRVLNYDKFNMETPDFIKLEEASETMPFMAEKRIVDIKGLDLSKEGISKNKSFYKELEHYLENISQDTIVLLRSKTGKFFKGSLYKKAEKTSHLVEMTPLDNKQFMNFIVKKLGRSEVRISDTVVRQLMDILAYGQRDVETNLYDVENELDKIISVSKNNQVSLEDIQNVYGHDKLGNIFKYTDALCSKTEKVAFDTYFQLRKDKDAGFIFHMVIRQFRNILNVKILKKQGRSDYEIKKLTGLKDYEFKKIMSIQGKYSMRELKNIFSSLYLVEVNHKSGKGDLDTNMIRLMGDILA